MPNPSLQFGWIRKMEDDLNALDGLLGSLGITLPPSSPLLRDSGILREFIADEKRDKDAILINWINGRFKEWYGAMLVAGRLCPCVAALSRIRKDAVAEKLLLAASTDLAQDSDQSQAKNALYELEIASILARVGYQVDLKEPDIIISGNDLAAPLGIACKMPASYRKIYPHMNYGYDQIQKSGIRGLVAISLDLIVLDKIRKPFIFFPDNPIDILAGTHKEIDKVVAKLVQDQMENKGTPHRRPLSSALFTISLGGVHDKGIRFIYDMGWHCVEGDQIIFEFQRIIENLKRLNTEPIR